MKAAAVDDTATQAACPVLFGDPSAVAKDVFGLDGAYIWEGDGNTETEAPPRTDLGCTLKMVGGGTKELYIAWFSTSPDGWAGGKIGTSGGLTYGLDTRKKTLTADQSKKVADWMAAAAKHVKD